ncbi:uncharacterized protein FOMMEDRAFT_164708 [Fomitiporia mediterranea MF3/22]|uniref:uncharacterized protein n=1 Tax=Fomitiporia mediterranea (strain MF3/22) TaxID=694068 RepID=UPI0004409C16|nr:uncharacterized protein FOMMEDRAFT_164708 [Fomitiporia mediterranea MF3/22]EJD07856.1 hypothetical protein FOMMEDRAFT_164708 [Fomitiporia mediterranea MF3/22]
MYDHQLVVSFNVPFAASVYFITPFLTTFLDISSPDPDRYTILTLVYPLWERLVAVADLYCYVVVLAPRRRNVITDTVKDLRNVLPSAVPTRSLLSQIPHGGQRAPLFKGPIPSTLPARPKESNTDSFRGSRRIPVLASCCPFCTLVVHVNPCLFGSYFPR